MNSWLPDSLTARHRARRQARTVMRSSAGWSLLLVVGLIVTGAVVGIDHPAGPSGGSGSATGRAAVRSAGILPVVRMIALPPARDKVRVPAHRTQRFSLLGLTWTDPHARLTGEVQARTRSAATGVWHTWTVSGGDRAGDAPGVAVRGGSEPVWVGDSDGVALRVDGRPTSRLPAGLRLDLVDPGRTGSSGRAQAAIAPAAYTVGDDAASSSATTSSPATSSSITSSPATTSSSTTSAATTSPATTPAATTSPSTTSAATTSPSTTSAATTSPSTAPSSPVSSLPTSPTQVGPPGMVSRSGWQADESLRRSAPTYTKSVKVVFVHHTDTTNDYACSESAAIIRSMYGYHVLSLGWNDIGYNFLVDRCGTLFEGRYGGADRAVLGAHTYGFNTDSTGIAVIGTYTVTPAPTAVLDTLARLAAWKLALSAVVPSATSSLTEAASDSHGFTLGATYTFAGVSGHRDGYATECPGDGLYAELAAVRTSADRDAQLGGLALTAISGATAAGGRWYTTGHLTVGWTSTVPADQVIGYDVLVDGRPAVSAAPTARSAAVALTPGSHAVALQVRYVPGLPTPAVTTAITTAVNTSATPVDGPQASSTSTAAPQSIATVPLVVMADATPPVFATVPTVGIRAGMVAMTGVPVSLAWRATDNGLLAKVTASWSAAATFGPTTTRWNTVARPGSGTVTVTAYDVAGNSRTVRASGLASLRAAVTAARTGHWTTSRNAAYLGGTALATTSRNAALTWTFTGRGVAWIAERSATSGQAAVYLDGARVGTVDLASVSAAHRQAAWVRNGLTAGRHVLRIVALATPHRPTVVTDGIATLA
jgi:hypothetical protein